MARDFPGLVALTRSSNPSHHDYATTAIKYVSRPVGASRLAIYSALVPLESDGPENDGEDARKIIAEFAGNVDVTQSDGVLAALLKLLNDADETRQQHAARILLMLALNDECRQPMVQTAGLVATLVTAMHESGWNIRRHAAWTLFWLTLNDECQLAMVQHIGVVAPLLALLRSEDQHVRNDAGRILIMLSANDRCRSMMSKMDGVAAGLLTLVRDGAGNVQKDAAQVLNNLTEVMSDNRVSALSRQASKEPVRA